MTFDKILVAVDFSEHSTAATRVALQIAERYGASVTFVHVFQPVAYILPEGFMVYGPSELSELTKNLGDLLTAEKRKARETWGDRVEAELLQGVPATEIVRYARENSCNLIVMGTHGRTGIKHAVMGSIAERVVRTAHCPVLTVPLPKQQA